MRPGLTFQITPVELVQSLKRDAAIFFSAEQGGNFLPCLALLALRADKIHERFEAAAISASAATPFIFGFRIHSPDSLGQRMWIALASSGWIRLESG